MEPYSLSRLLPGMVKGRITCILPMGPTMWSVGQERDVAVWSRDGTLVKSLKGHNSFINHMCRIKSVEVRTYPSHRVVPLPALAHSPSRPAALRASLLCAVSDTSFSTDSSHTVCLSGAYGLDLLERRRDSSRVALRKRFQRR